MNASDRVAVAIASARDAFRAAQAAYFEIAMLASEMRAIADELHLCEDRDRGS